MDRSSDSLDPWSPHPGLVVAGRYRLVRPVGAGGLASVWEAEHVTLHSAYAVKFLHQTGPADGDPSQRFLREARIAASIKHRNVLEIVDFGFADGAETKVEGAKVEGAVPRGVPYMVMELLHGRTLAALLAAEPKLDVRRAVEIASGVLRGLTAVHAAGLIHRDVKPANVFLVEDEDGAFPKLVDFGLSRRTGRSDLTLEGTLLGTPLYMAPEQVQGRGDLDARVDIYAMGVVLYEMLTGRPPFASTSIAELLDRIVHQAPPPLGELAPHVPQTIVDVVETAMQKDPARRFADARAMRATLLDAMAMTPTAPMPRLTPVEPRRESPAPTAHEEIATPPPVREDEGAVTEQPVRGGESAWLVTVRACVFAALAIGVAVLVLEGPWSPTGASDSAADGGTIVPFALGGDAAPGLDAHVSALVAVDAATMDAAVEDAALPEDAAVEDAALPEDAWAEDAASEDAAEPAEPELDAGARERITTQRGARPPAHARPPRTTHPRSPRHRTPAHSTHRRHGPRHRRPRGR